MEAISCSRFRKPESLLSQGQDSMLLKSRWLYSSFIKWVLFTGKSKATEKRNLALCYLSFFYQRHDILLVNWRGVKTDKLEPYFVIHTPIC